MADQPAPDDTEELLAAAESLRDEMRRFRNTRQLLVAAMTMLTAALIAAVVLFSVYETNTRAQANQNHALLNELKANQVIACRVGNDLRARERLLWQHLLIESEKQGQVSKAGRAFVAYAERTFPPLNCEQLYATGG